MLALKSKNESTDRMMSSGETAEYSAAAPKGNAEALRQKGRTRTTLRKVRLRTPKVQPAAMTRAGNLSGDQRRHKAQKGVLCLFFDA